MYQISIVTPFHNVAMELFRRSYESLQAQTLGFQNIQWIVVLHNTEPQYQEAVHALLREHDNVIIQSIDNDIHTPSSPRNHGMKLATAPYLGFLDGDDSYTPDCLETAIRRMRAADAQMVVFRREFRMEQEDLMPLTEIVMWDQTQEEIIVDREHWEDKKMFSGVWGMVTSRIFDRLFLEKHHITFDEEVPFTEDNLFLIEAYGKVDRVCYLPQFIGYRYFIHGDSLVQSMGKRSGAELISYAKGFCKIFDAAFRNGIYADWFMSFTLTAYAQAMLHAPNLTLADRQAIKEILEPYVHQIPLLPVNKLTSESDARMFFQVPRDVILHPEHFDRGGHMQTIWDGQDVLLSILRRNQSTDYGVRYHFEALRTAEGYQKRVPFSSYDTYAPLVELQTKIGERGIFSADPTVCYLLSADAVGAPRLIPATEKHLEPYLRQFAQAVRKRTTFLLFESLPMRTQYNDRTALNSLSGIILSAFLREERDTLYAGGAKFTSPEILLAPPSAMDTLYLRLLFALKEREVEQIVSPFVWGIVEVLSVLERRHEDLCSDIERGRIDTPLDIPEPFLRQINGLLHPDRERAEELRRIFREGFRSPVVKKIWPRIRCIVACGTGGFRIYRDRLKRYAGDIPFSNGVLAFSAALVGKAIGETEDYEMVTGHCFYEFLPCCDGGREPAPLMLSQLQAGEDYELVVTNQAGFYRYRTGCLIRVKENKNGRVVFRFLGHKSQFARLDSVIFGEDDVYAAIVEAADDAVPIADFAFYADSGERRWVILLEPEEQGFDADWLSPDKTDALAQRLDTALGKVNPAYAAARAAGLSPCCLGWNEPQTHFLYRDMTRFRHQTAPDQIKPAHCLTDPRQIKLFRQMRYGRGV